MIAKHSFRSTPAIPHPAITALILAALLIGYGAVMLAAVRWLNWWVS